MIANTLKTLLVLLNLALLSLAFVGSALAHESRPIYYQVTEIASAEAREGANEDAGEGKKRDNGVIVQVQGQIPRSVPDFAIPQLVLPQTCQQVSPATGRLRSYQQSAQYLCSQGLAGQTLELAFPNINPSVSSLIRVNLAGGELHTQLIQPGETSWQVPLAESMWSVAKQYALMGMLHIWLGIDHLLFVACLLFIARTPKRMLVTITGFTLAHSVTLILSTLDWVRLPIPPVEAVIALSIVLLAHEIAVDDKRSWTIRYPVSVSTSFGLLHGFGFAAVLNDLGLPQIAVGTALVFFNIGVEIGQLLFIAALVSLVLVSHRLLARLNNSGRLSHQSRGLDDTLTLIKMPASYVIGVLATFWLLQRVAGFV